MNIILAFQLDKALMTQNNIIFYFMSIFRLSIDLLLSVLCEYLFITFYKCIQSFLKIDMFASF